MRHRSVWEIFKAFCIIVNLVFLGFVIWMFVKYDSKLYELYIMCFIVWLIFKADVSRFDGAIGKLRSSDLFNRHKLQKFSVEDEVEYMVDCVLRAQETLDSEEFERFAFHSKRLTEIITSVEEKGQQRKYKRLKERLTIIGCQAKECKGRVDKAVEKKCG